MPVDAANHAQALLTFLDASPSPYHAVATAAAMLAAAGSRTVDPRGPWPTGPGAHHLVAGGALIAWVEPPDARAATPFRIVGAHTDSPGLRLKPRPDSGSAGWRQVAVDAYGSPLLSSWLDRDLGMAGRLALRSGATVPVRLDAPLFRLPRLAIHLGRDGDSEGAQLDRQLQLRPVWGLGTPREGELVGVAAAAAGVAAEDVASFDLTLVDVQPAALLGPGGEFVSGARLDDQFCAWAAITAMLAADPAGPADGTAAARVTSGSATEPEMDPVRRVVALFDHEEVGSGTTTGAGGALLPTVCERIVLAAGGTREDLHRALASSLLVSADMAHAAHPTYPDRREPEHAPVPNAGPVLKVDANQHYATDAVTGAAFRRACDAAGVPVQVFVNRGNLRCGSTIGPVLAARLGAPTVDVGAAQLSMHSVRELAGAADAQVLVRALAAVLAGA